MNFTVTVTEQKLGYWYVRLTDHSDNDKVYHDTFNQTIYPYKTEVAIRLIEQVL